MFEGGGQRPSAGDLAFVESIRDSRSAGAAGALLSEWIQAGLVEGIPPQKRRSHYQTGGLGGGYRGAA
jgi:hypothetical protein